MSDNIESILGVGPGTSATPGSQALYHGREIVEGSVWSFDGRIGRGSFWARILSLAALNLVVGFILGLISVAGEGVAVLAFVLNLAYMVGAVWFGLATQVKRWHDMDKSGWMVAWNFTIIAMPITLIVMGCVHGTIGPNRFGADPLPTPTLSASIAG